MPPVRVDLDDVRRLLHEHDAQLVEALPRDEYEVEHLPGAIALPLKELTAEAASERLDRDRPVVAYCWDDG
jgi:rhodanese-related sulfurtransferase